MSLLFTDCINRSAERPDAAAADSILFAAPRLYIALHTPYVRLPHCLLLVPIAGNACTFHWKAESVNYLSELRSDVFMVYKSHSIPK